MNEKKNLTTEETFSLAVKNHKKKKFKIAENLYIKTLKFDPNFVNAHYNLGLTFIKLRKLLKAKESFLKVIQIIPNFAIALNALGYISNSLDKTEDAIYYYNKVLSLDSNNINVLYNLAKYYQDNLMFDHSIKFYTGHYFPIFEHRV